MEFLFTLDNQNLEDKKEAWLSGEKFGAYVLVGDSGSGKTTFLRQLDKEWQKKYHKEMITWITVEELIDVLVEEKDIFEGIQTPIVVLENMEGLVGKDSTITCFWDLLDKWLQAEKRLFIGTTNDDNIIIPQYVEVLKNLEIELTSDVVRRVALMSGVDLNDERIIRLSDESEGSMSKLIGLIKREKLFV